MNRKIATLLLLLFICSSEILFSQAKPVELRAALQSDSIMIGDRLELRFDIKMADTDSVRLVFPHSIPGSGVELIGKPMLDTLVTDSGYTLRLKALITSFDSGMQVVPRLPLLVTGGDTLYSDSLSFWCSLTPRDSSVNGFYDIKQPIEEPLTFAEVAPWVGAGLIVVLLIIALILYLRSRKQNKPFLKLFKAQEQPHVVAIRALERMRDEKLWQTEKPKYYYTLLVDVLRTYIKGRFGIDASEMTSNELLGALGNVDFDLPGEQLYKPLAELLLTSDLVKFAKHVTSADENERNLRFAFEFVERTKPEEEVQDEKEEAPSDSVSAKADVKPEKQE